MAKAGAGCKSSGASIGYFDTKADYKQFFVLKNFGSSPL